MGDRKQTAWAHLVLVVYVHALSKFARVQRAVDIISFSRARERFTTTKVIGARSDEDIILTLQILRQRRFLWDDLTHPSDS